MNPATSRDQRHREISDTGEVSDIGEISDTGELSDTGETSDVGEISDTGGTSDTVEISDIGDAWKAEFNQRIERAKPLMRAFAYNAWDSNGVTRRGILCRCGRE